MFVFHSNYAFIYYRFRDKAAYRSKIVSVLTQSTCVTDIRTELAWHIHAIAYAFAHKKP